MPKSKGRTKRPSELAGIPARILSLSPHDWAPAQRAAWCRHYLDGAAGRPFRDERSDRRGFSPSWPRMAYRKGADEAEQSRADVAQTDQRAQELARSRRAIRARRDMEARSSRSDLLRRIDGLDSFGGLGGFDPHADPRIMGAAIGALGLGLQALGRPVGDDEDA